MQQWRELPANMPILGKMRPIAYKARGSRYGACGIRIDGTPEFIDAVLSHLKELLAGENQVTRLELARNPVDGKGLDKSFENAETNAECCYIRLHVRGNEGSMAAAIFREHVEETKQYAAALGVEY